MSIMFDIGASTGVYAFEYLKQHPKSIIYCFEPNVKTFKKLQQHTKNDMRISIYNVAVSDTVGKSTFYEANYINSSSLLPFTKHTQKWKTPNPSIPKLETINTYDVDCIRLDDFIKQNDIEHIDYLKIDTQGHDLNVIKSLGGKINIVNEIVAEVQIVDFELYENSSKKEELIEYMKSNGFIIKKIQKWSQNQEENIWFINKHSKNS